MVAHRIFFSFPFLSPISSALPFHHLRKNIVSLISKKGFSCIMRGETWVVTCLITFLSASLYFLHSLFRILDWQCNRLFLFPSAPKVVFTSFLLSCVLSGFSDRGNSDLKWRILKAKKNPYLIHTQAIETCAAKRDCKNYGNSIIRFICISFLQNWHRQLYCWHIR